MPHYVWHILIALLVIYLVLGAWIASNLCRDIMLYRAQGIFMDGKRPAGVHWEPFVVFFMVLLGWPFVYFCFLMGGYPSIMHGYASSCVGAFLWKGDYLSHVRPIRILAIEQSDLMSEFLGGKLPHVRWATHLVVFRDKETRLDPFCLPDNVANVTVEYVPYHPVCSVMFRESLVDVIRPLARDADVRVFCTKMHPEFFALRDLINSHGGCILFYLPWEEMAYRFKIMGLEGTCTKSLDSSRLSPGALESYIQEVLGCSASQASKIARITRPVMAPADYCNFSPRRCPVCGASDKIKELDARTSAAPLALSLECDCGATWTEEAKVVGYTDLQEPKEIKASKGKEPKTRKGAHEK